MTDQVPNGGAAVPPSRPAAPGAAPTVPSSGAAVAGPVPVQTPPPVTAPAAPVRAAAPGPPDPPPVVEAVVVEVIPPRRSASIVNLATALCKAQKAMKPAMKSADNPFFKSKYADLAAIVEASREALTANDLVVLQPAGSQGQHIFVTTMLIHAPSGEFMEQDLVMKAAQNNPQAMGSAITYARRYGLAPMVGVVTEDDDGNAASSTLPAGVRRDTGARTALQQAQTHPAAQAAYTTPEPEDPGAKYLEGGGIAQIPAVTPAPRTATPRPTAGPPPPPPGAKPPARAPGA